MAWYSTGTVSLTASNNAVVGSGTNFIANARVGDAFRGPDGRWYEVTNIASATAISISPNYQGSTASGQAYSIAPMQGYVKASADALRQLTDSYGATISAIQPWATALTPSLALDALGFGATGKAIAATATTAAAQTAIDIVKTTSATDTTSGRVWRTNDLVKTTSSSDSTAGSIQRNGDWGSGGDGVLSNDWDAIIQGGLYYNSSSAAVGIPIAAAPIGCLHIRIGTTSAIQFAGRTGANQLYCRRKTGSAWQAWTELWTASNLVKTTSATDTTAGSVLTVGYQGLGAGPVPVTDMTIAAVNVASFFRIQAAATGGSGADGGVVALPYSATPFITYLQAANTGRVFSGVKSGASGTPIWYEQYGKANTSANVQTMLGAANNAAIRTAIDSSVFPVYTFATMPAAAANTNKGIIVSDLTGGREPCFSDGTNWRRASDRTIAS